ncbi:hypothetical protein HanIR_Chr05g0235501 [Helianthus annuus]|nr:hypothetical protein HanIR_Chr05g0235501 [Helianthus annuus]
MTLIRILTRNHTHTQPLPLLNTHRIRFSHRRTQPRVAGAGHVSSGGRETRRLTEHNSGDLH